jgi:DeoR family fructose operon transcriptional repressor
MLKNQRLELIRKMVKNKKIVRVDELVEVLKASESTVRRDLDELEKEGFLKRIHGGVQYINKIKNEAIIATKLEENSIEKEKIAAKASQLIDDGDCIFLDAGSTTYNMIPHLQNRNITVITNGLTHIDRLIDYNIDSYIVGGHIKPTTKAILGEETIEYINKYYFDKAFIGVNGLSFENGYSTPDVKEAAVKKTVISRSKDCFFLADSSKFDKSYFVKVAELDEGVLITDKLSEEYKNHTTMKVAK